MRKRSDKYWSLFEVAHERVVPLLKAGIHPGLLNPVFGLPQPKEAPNLRSATRNEQYWMEWFKEFSEIDASLRRLDQSLAYLAHYPRSRALRFHGLSEGDWIRYHIEAYLQETYILSERLRRFLKRVGKVAIVSRDKPGLSSVQQLQARVDTAFRNLVQTRGGHVHEHRFQDDALRDLDTLVLVTRGGKMRKIRWIRALKFDAALLKWSRQMRKNNMEIEELCIPIFQTATDILKRNEPARHAPVA